jgi:RHS repeat-associated protein
MDRLGSVPAPGSRYYPYGEESNPPANNADKFATYYRDATGLDYADQRYYASTLGRFLTADPYWASGGPSDPASWNRYAYVENDPVNFSDPEGLIRRCPSGAQTDQSGTRCIADTPLEVDWSWLEGPPGIHFSPTPSKFMRRTRKPKNKEPERTLVSVNKVRRNGVDYDQVLNRIYDLINGIDSDCLQFLQSGGNDLGPYINDILSQDLLAVGELEGATAAFTGIGGTTLKPGEAAIVVNTNSAFFNGAYSVDRGRINGNTRKAQAFILLHEFAHALGANSFQDDFRKPGAGAANDRLIEKNCNKTLEQFK